MDHLGSTRAMLDGAGGVLSQCNYAPFGKIQVVNGATSREGYLDREKDKETTLSSFGLRAYDDNYTNRFLSPDPKWEKYGHLSPYAYASNNPVGLSDATGDTITISGKTVNEVRDLLNTLQRITGTIIVGRKLTVVDGRLQLTITSFVSVDARFKGQQNQLLGLMNNSTHLMMNFVGDAGAYGGGYYDPDNHAVGISDRYKDGQHPDIAPYLYDTGERTNDPAGWIFGYTKKVEETHEIWDTMAHELLGHAYDYIVAGKTGMGVNEREQSAIDAANRVRMLRGKYVQTGSPRFDEKREK